MAPLEIDKTCILRAKGFNTELSASLSVFKSKRKTSVF